MSDMSNVEQSLFPKLCPDRPFPDGQSSEPERRTPPEMRVTMEVTYRDIFTVEELWPDGDWPDDITEDAVLELVEEYGTDAVIADWNLSETDVLVSVSKPAKVGA